MSNSTSLLDQISSTQSNKEVTANALFDAASPGMVWGRHASTTVGLTWGYYGGYYNGNSVANGTLTLTASATNYVYADNVTGAVSVNTTGVPAGKIPLYSVVAGASTVSSYTDLRAYQPLGVSAGNTPYDMAAFAPGVLSASQKIMRVNMARPVTLPVGLAGSYATSGTAASGSSVFNITQNGTSIGSITFADSSSTGTFTFTAAVNLAAGDVLQITGPATPDGTLADVSLTLVGGR